VTENGNKIKIAVIIPCYNAQKTIQTTLESVLQQTFGQFKIYVVNDGSTDDTSIVLSKFQEKYSEKIDIITQRNQGQARARNRGIQESSEEYIAFIDSDDLWHPEKLEKQFSFLKANNNIGMCYTQGLEIDEQENKIGTIPVNPLYKGDCFQRLILSNNIVASSVMVRRSVLDRVGMFDTSLGACENWDLWLRISKEFLIDFLDVPLTYYRIHQNNMSQNSDKMYRNRKKVLEKHLLSSTSKSDLTHLIRKAFHKHHKLYGLRLVEELKLSMARKELVKALKYNRFDSQLYKVILKTFLGKGIFLLARKIKKV
jgi:glycosyltransferase involved in cell wall biosynthesis